MSILMSIFRVAQKVTINNSELLEVKGFNGIRNWSKRILPLLEIY